MCTDVHSSGSYRNDTIGMTHRREIFNFFFRQIQKMTVLWITTIVLLCLVLIYTVSSCKTYVPYNKVQLRFINVFISVFVLKN